jgi:hypothetical protein
VTRSMGTARATDARRAESMGSARATDARGGDPYRTIQPMPSSMWVAGA